MQKDIEHEVRVNRGLKITSTVLTVASIATGAINPAAGLSAGAMAAGTVIKSVGMVSEFGMGVASDATSYSVKQETLNLVYLVEDLEYRKCNSARARTRVRKENDIETYRADPSPMKTIPAIKLTS